VILSVSPEFSGFSVHIHTYLVQPKTGADRRIKLLRPGRSLLALLATLAAARVLLRAATANLYACILV
jgi:hypothetical protein